MTQHPLPSLGWSDALETARRAHDPNLLPARVSAEHRGRLGLLTPLGETTALIPRDVEAHTGDWVLVAPGPAPVRVVAALPRRTCLERNAAGRATARQVVAANLDLVFVLTSLNQDFNVRRVERFLAAARAGGVAPVVALSKADLAPSAVHRHLRLLEEVAGDAPVIAVSALYAEGLDELGAFLAPGRTLGFIGTSGVGKSTLVNALLGEDRQHVRHARVHDDRGQHTTTGRTLHLIPGDRGLLLDTPGMREIALWSGDGLDETFADVVELATGCRYRDCQHETEPGCAVLAAIEAGDLAVERLNAWIKLQREAAWQEARQDVFLRREQRRAFAKMVREAGKTRY